SVTNEFGRIHDTTNCYVASPAIFPALGSPNPMLTGIALAHRTSDMLTANVLPQPLARVIDPGFTALFDGKASTFNSWKSADAKKVGGNAAWGHVISGFEVQIDDNARGDVNKDFYGRKPEPDGLWKNRTGAVYKIPAGDFIYHLGRNDDRLQQYTPGPPVVPGVWFQYDIVGPGNHHEVTLTNTQSGASQITTIFDNPDAARGTGQIN